MLRRVGRLLLSKTLLVIEIVAGYAAFVLSDAIGVWLVFGQFISLGRLFRTPQLPGLPVLLVTLIKAVLFTAAIYGLQRLHRQHLSDLGLRHVKRPPGWWQVLLVAVGASILAQGLAIAVAALMGASAEADLSAFDLRTLPSVLGWIGVGWVHGGFIEELLYRGFLFTRLEALFGRGRWGTVLAVLLLVAFFGLGHAYQGWWGMLSTGFSALVFFGVYFWSKRNLWATILMHGCYDTVGWLLIISSGG